MSQELVTDTYTSVCSDLSMVVRVDVAQGPQPVQASLFLLRLCDEKSVNSDAKWYGSILHLPSGEIHHFHDWVELVEVLLGTTSWVPDRDAPQEREASSFPLSVVPSLEGGKGSG